VIACEGLEVSSTRDLVRAVAWREPGAPVRLRVLRGSETRVFDVRLTDASVFGSASGERSPGESEDQGRKNDGMTEGRSPSKTIQPL